MEIDDKTKADFIDWYISKTFKEKVLPWVAIGSILLVTVIAMKKI